ncbi:MAG: hypothetical protein FJ344_02845 [Sphingomonadales bacterium]|nr:hypothetical protein [Sphingomonadales bacterium]
MRQLLVSLLLFLVGLQASAQSTDSSRVDDDEDYGSAELAGGGSSRSYASARIVGTSPQRFITLAFDHQLGYDMNLSDWGEFADDSIPQYGRAQRVKSTGGLRFNASIPVISRNNLVWQLGGNYWESRYQMEEPIVNDILAPVRNVVATALKEGGLRTAGLNTTIYKPLNAEQFLLVQASVDMSGDFGIELQPVVRTSAAVIWGKRPHERKQWGVGLVRTYRVGALNYLPVYMLNWTAPNRRWGFESLLPARASIRYNIDRNSMLLGGFELEGQSYRIERLSLFERGEISPPISFEIRRGELRPRLEYLRQLKGYWWMHAQAGIRLDYSFDADELQGGKEFFRGFFGDQPFAMINSLGNTPYFQLGINFVSP